MEGKDKTPLNYNKILNDFTEHKTEILKEELKTTNKIYKIIRKKFDDLVDVPVEMTWQRAIRWKQIQWKKIWQHTYNSYNTGKTNDILYKVLHNCFGLETR